MPDPIPAADLLAALDRAWMARAACAGMPAEWWAPTTDRTQIARAAAICARCPVRQACGGLRRR